MASMTVLSAASRGLSRLVIMTAALGTAACGDSADTSASATGGPSTVGPTTPTTPTTSDTGPTSSATGTATETGGSDSQTGTTQGAPTGSTGETTSGTGTSTGVIDDTSASSSSTGPAQPVCGNGLLDEGEECDDGNDFDKDSCSNACTKVPCDQQEGNPGELLSFIWIANSSEGTVSKIDTKTGLEVGRYRVEGGSPSRTSVNLMGDVAVSSRDPGGVTKIAARPADCKDKNGNGMIETSKGANDILAFGADECVLWTKKIPSPGYGYGPRATAWEGGKPDPNTCVSPTPRLWFGWMDGNNMAHFERVDGDTGVTLDTVMYPWQPGYSPYGGAVNAVGDFFVTGLSTQPAISINAVTLAITDFGVPQGCKYGMTLDTNGNIWNGGCNDSSVYHYDMQAKAWSNIGNAGGSRVNGMMADADGNVWGAGSNPCRLVHIDAATKKYVNNNIPLPGCQAPWGVSIDIDGYVWVVDMSASLAYKVHPETYQVELTVKGLVGPYTYSDMTGAALNAQVNPQ